MLGLSQLIIKQRTVYYFLMTCNSLYYFNPKRRDTLEKVRRATKGYTLRKKGLGLGSVEVCLRVERPRWPPKREGRLDGAS